MSAAPERREPIDINEFERRLLSPEPARRGEDPLVELARLLNQQQQTQAADPIASLFAETRAPAPGPAAPVPPVSPAAPMPPMPPFTAAPPVAPHQPPMGDAFSDFPDFPDLRPLLRGGAEGPAVVPPRAAPDYPSFAPEPVVPDTFPEPLAPSAQYADWAEAPELTPEAAPAEPPRPRSRKPLYIAGAVIVAGFAAIGSTLAWRGGAHQAGGVATIAASTAPTKIQPKESENGDKTARESTMLERTAAPPVKKVVSREEQPMDVSTAARTPRVIPLDDGGANAAAPAPAPTSAASVTPPPPPQREVPAARSAFPEPKRVKTVSVRADGSIIGAEAAAPAAAAPKPPERPAAPARNATPKSAARADATTSVAAPKPAARAVVARPKPEPKAAPKPERVAAVSPAQEEQPAAEPAEEAEAPKAVASGGYALQIASAGSESEARQTASRLAAKLSGALGGRHPAVIRASEKLYRVRVTGLSKESAVAMCGRVKAAGGACFVAR